MDYREWPPHPALRPFVRAYGALGGASADARPQPVLPDGSSELIVHRERPFAGSTPEELRRRLAQMTVWMLAARPR